MLCIFAACNNESKKMILLDIPKKFKVDSLLISQICTLNDSMKLLGEVRSFEMINDSIFVVSSSKSAQVIVFNINGEQLFEIGSKGNGPFEYISPSLVRFSDQKYYVWCSMKLKLIVYDRNGIVIKEYTNFNKAINDFVIHENYLYLYSSGGFDDPIIQIYDLNKGEFIRKSFGEQSNEHRVLNSFSGAGGMALTENGVIFSPNDELIAYKISLDNFSYSVFKINESDFKVKKIDVDPREFMADPASMQYIFSSDIVTGVFCTNDFIILMCETGEIELNGFQIVDSSKRRQKYYIINNDLDLRYSIETYCDPGGNSMYSSFGEKIYKIRFNENLEYELCAVDLFNFL